MYTLITITLILSSIVLAIKLVRARKANIDLSHHFEETSLILESLHDGIIECDVNLVPTRANKATETILNIEASEIVNRTVDRNNPAQEIDKILVQILYAPKDAKESYDVTLPTPLDKKLRVFTLPKTEPRTKTLAGYIKIVRDVSIETVVEKHKNDLVSVVSHQLLTPLTGIKWILKSLVAGDGGTLNEKQVEMINKGLGANEDMIGLVTDILDVTKVEQAQFTYHIEPHNIIEFIKSLVGSRQEKALLKKVTLATKLSDAVLEVPFDKERLNIALSNLLDNAIDYSQEGRTVTCSVTSSNDKVFIEVADQGIGISVNDQAHLFTKFYRAENAKRVRSSGTGLGLYLAKHIANDHGGTIGFETREGVGTTFTITLPLKIKV